MGLLDESHKLNGLSIESFAVLAKLGVCWKYFKILVGHAYLHSEALWCAKFCKANLCQCWFWKAGKRLCLHAGKVIPPKIRIVQTL